MDSFDLYILIRKSDEKKYRYPYTAIANELEVSRNAVWNECNGVHTSAVIRQHIAKILHKKESDIFPVKRREKEAA